MNHTTFSHSFALHHLYLTSHTSFFANKQSKKIKNQQKRIKKKNEVHTHTRTHTYICIDSSLYVCKVYVCMCEWVCMLVSFFITRQGAPWFLIHVYWYFILCLDSFLLIFCFFWFFIHLYLYFILNTHTIAQAFSVWLLVYMFLVLISLCVCLCVYIFNSECTWVCSYFCVYIFVYIFLCIYLW